MGVSRTTSTRRSTWRWRETVGCGRPSTAWRSDTNSGAAARQFRIRSRVGSALVRAAAPLQDTAHVVLVATTDVHGRATDWDYAADRPFAGGLARVAAVADSLRARYPGQVVLVDAGDLLQGDAFATYFARVAPTVPHPIVEAMNLAGYDAATPGDHDFDWGLQFFRAALADARFPYVSANLYATAGDTLLYPPYRVVQPQ